MKTECASLFGVNKRFFNRIHCDKCQKETIHQGAKCLSCGSFIRMKGSVGPAPLKKNQKRRLINQSRVNREKRVAFARAAEESRAKFEGKG